NLIYPLSEGLHQISLVKEGYSLFSTSRLVSVGKVDTVKAPLMSLAGKLKIKTDPPGAKLYLNKKFQGIVSEQGMVIEDLTDSLYKIKAVKWGYKSFNAKWTPNPGRETKIEAKMPLRRWKVNFLSLEFVMVSAPSTETYGTEPFMEPYVEPSQEMTVTDDDFEGEGFGVEAGVGFAISRNLTLGLMYQFRTYPDIIDKKISFWEDTTEVRGDMEISFTSHSPLVNLTVTVPWGKLEPYGEIRYGGITAKADGEYNCEYLSRNVSSELITDSTTTIKINTKIDHSTLQVGGGFLVWLRPDREALRVYCMYSRDSFKGFALPWEQQEVDLTVSGLQFGTGITVHF
ncbi:MAG: hypothetical protein KJ620_09485, partial [Candidatus Edwardsbacteria bacterium]|nr:hypothetical protein [Candidatus Edwardsbacteria bacterium]MBU1576195.1 hypothetical protein [Candidatus Edwardsbacteria bacterium]MBU2462848.1 hypothetical protein [Candidatus Edwardsbacteria bacterium]